LIFLGNALPAIAVVIDAIISIFLLIALTNLLFIRKFRTPVVASNLKVSILVPARNEQHGIEKCVKSLLAQNLSDFEVIVMDDNSTDETGAILSRLQDADGRLRVIKGTNLPEGWLGKNWACWQLYMASAGDVLVFCDADTWHEPDSIAAALDLLKKERAQLMTCIVRHETATFLEKVAVPQVNWNMMCLMPAFLSHHSKEPNLVMGSGSCMVFERGAYELIGGHESVKAVILEDLGIAKMIKVHGMKAILGNAAGFISCRMYRSNGEVISGFSKNFLSAFGYRLMPFFATVSAFALAVVLPALLIIDAFIRKDSGNLPIALSAYLLLLVIRFIVDTRTKASPLLFLTFPLTMLAWSLLGCLSLYRHIKGTSEWKGRKMPKPNLRMI